jgi:uncharacterized protein YkwD
MFKFIAPICLFFICLTNAFGVELYQIEADMLKECNAHRQRAGLPPLVIDEHLLNRARKHCETMATKNSLYHAPYPCNENIAWGQQNAISAYNSWMNSSGHRSNILGGRFRKTGIACYQGSSGLYWCQQFD